MADQRGGKEFSVKSQITAVTSAYEKAKKENDYVYHERVPDYKSLGPIDRAQLAKPTPVKFPISEDFRGIMENSNPKNESNLHWFFPIDLFATLVPMAVHNGLQTFKSKKMDAFNLEIGKLRQATELLNAYEFIFFIKKIYQIL